MKNIQSIINNKFFSGISEQVVASIFDPKEFKELKEGKVIYKTGDESDFLFLLIKGDVKVKFSTNNFVSSRASNDFFGEKELIDNTQRASSAVAFSELIVYRLDKKIFADLVSKNTALQNNIRKHGELKLPEINTDNELKINITERKKPVQFKAGPQIVNSQEEKKETLPREIAQSLSPLETVAQIRIDKDLSVVESENYASLSVNQSDLESSSDESGPREDLKNKVPDDSHNYNNHNVEEGELINDFSVLTQPKQLIDKTEAINREYIRKILGCIEIINSGITLEQLVNSVIKAIKILTQSEDANLILIDEKLSLMHKYTGDGEKLKEEHFQIPDGLTGTSALQKKILNFERPTEDSRFNSSIDQPGSARLKRILYFPIINDTGETIAVLQLAREHKKYSDDDISGLNLLVRYIESSIQRSKGFEELILNEKLLSNKRIRDFILNEIREPIGIINDYVEILSGKNLSPEEIEEIIMMLQKQANSVEDISSTIFNCILDSATGEIKLDQKEIHFNEFIHDILELLSEYCESQERKLFKKIGDGSVVKIDRAKFYTAIYEVIKLCCEDSKKGSNIYFSSELKNDSIQITINDEGKGSLAEINGNISNYLNLQYEFTQVETGFLIAEKIILTHDGQFHVESIKGKGTTFTISLPVSPK